VPLNQEIQLIDKLIKFCLENKVVVLLLIILIVGWGLLVAPFDWDLGGLPRNPVPVDAIPDIGENQQIVFTEWMGRSPQDVEDQITYPMTVSLLGIPGVKTIRSFSMFGFSTVYVIFNEDIEFYWSRSRILEKLNSLPSGTLPQGVKPSLGPDATALGQVFWYTLEGRDEYGNPAGGWDLHELRTIQDWYVRFSLMSSEGISEVASVGGFVQEYQIDVDPDAMRVFKVSIDEVFKAVKNSNVEVGARTIEINKVEYVIRGLGFVKHLKDLENAVIKVNNNVPVYVKNIGKVNLGPSLRRGALDKEGSEVVGGVAVVRYGDNPLAAIKNIKKKIEEISPGLPIKELPDGTLSKITIVPFYDRTGLIYETLNTLNKALIEEILVAIIIVLVMVMHFRSSILITGLLPLAVLMCFIAMKTFGVDANIVALSGIAIAIGTMVDMGIVICENILNHLEKSDPEENKLDVIYRAASEVGGAVFTAVSTTIVSFLPVFTMEAAEGKLFKPLAFTKTFALLASVIVALTIIPPVAHLLFTGKIRKKTTQNILFAGLFVIGLLSMISLTWWVGVILIVVSLYHFLANIIPDRFNKYKSIFVVGSAVFCITLVLTRNWLPLGAEKAFFLNFIFIIILIGGLLFFFHIFQKFYGRILSLCLDNKIVFLAIPTCIVIFGAMIWLGFGTIFGWLPESVKRTAAGSYFAHKFPGLGREFMPSLDEGSYLYMPTTMPHASIGEVLDVLQKQDIALANVPETDSVVGKLGRAETPLDPAPVSMIETIINYKSEYIVDSHGKRLRFKFEQGETDFVRTEDGERVSAPDGEPYKVQGKFVRDDQNRLIPDKYGKPFRLWRPPLNPDLNDDRKIWKGIRNPDDIWKEIVRVTEVPGTTSAPKLQPIAARIVMLQSGMRAPLGLKIKGPDLETLDDVGLKLEQLLKEVPAIDSATVIADRIVGKPYLEIDIDRQAIARYGIMLQQVQNTIEVAIGGKPITTTVEGRERYAVRVRYLRELRDNIESLERILIQAPDGTQIPLIQLAELEYKRGPQMIKSEDTFLVGYVLFDKHPQYAEVDVVEQAQEYLKSQLDSGNFQLPAGVSYKFAGSYENQVRAQKKLTIVLPLALFIIFLILYLQFRSVAVSSLIFSGIIVAWAGGFIMLWFYAQPWFLDFSVFGVHMRELFQVQTINLSVAVWVGFLALFGIASDDGVIITTYLEQSFRKRKPITEKEIKLATIEAGKKRVRPCLMTTATTVLALIPVLTSTGRGSDIMVPMAIPSFGGMLIAIITMFVVPVLYCSLKELDLKFQR